MTSTLHARPLPSTAPRHSSAAALGAPPTSPPRAMASAATPAVQHILDNLDSCDTFFIAQQGVIDHDSMASSQQSLCMSVQLQLNNVSLMSPVDAAAVTNRVMSSLFSEALKQRLAGVVSPRVGHLVAPASRLQTIAAPLCYPSCFALAAAACSHAYIYI